MSSHKFPADRSGPLGSRPVYLGRDPVVVLHAVRALPALEFVPALSRLFPIRFVVGLAESAPGARQCPHRRQLVSERRTRHRLGDLQRHAIFLALVFTALMGWLAQNYGWPSFFLDGPFRPSGAALFFGVCNPVAPPADQQSRIRLYRSQWRAGPRGRTCYRHTAFPWNNVRQLLANRMLIGIYLAQYCITALTYFYATWFPVYLMQERHMYVVHAGF